MAAGRIVITGPGRSGTTLLVQLLAELGFETGLERLQMHAGPRAGLEYSLLAPDAPRVVKEPWLTFRLRGMIESGQVDPSSIDWVIVPLRDLDEATASRVVISADERDVEAYGGLFATTRPSRQRDTLAAGVYGLFETIARYELPLIVLAYPAFATDAGYAFRRLGPMLGDISESQFDQAWRSAVDPALVRSEPIDVPRLSGVFIMAGRLGRWVSLRREAAAARRRTPQ